VSGADRHGLTDGADVAAFLGRLVRLDPAAVVRLRRGAGPAGRVTLWAPLPWGVLVARSAAGGPSTDVTVGARALLDEVSRGGPALPPRRDADWRWPLPAGGGEVVERVREAEVRRIAAAAAGTLRTASAQGVGGRAVGQRALRDALLDHVAIVVSPPAGGAPVEVSQRLVQAVVRMGFLGAADEEENRWADVRVFGRWVALSAPYGIAWLPPVSQFAMKPRQAHPFGR
jgi:hypothetical protein